MGRTSCNKIYVPEQHQYRPEKSLKESGKFMVNKTWVKHGLAIVNEAMHEKKKKPSNNKIAVKPSAESSNILEDQRQSAISQMTYNPNINELNSSGNRNESVNLKRITTDDLLVKAKLAECEKSTRKLTRTDSSHSIESAASRYIMTKESWGTEDEREDVSFDDDTKENTNTNRNGVSLQTFSTGNLSGFSLESSFIHDACELSLRKDKDYDAIETESKVSEVNLKMDTSIDRYSIEDGATNV